MRFAVLACLFLFISIEPIPGQVPDKPSNDSKNPKQTRSKQKQPTQKVVAPPLVQMVAPQVSQDGGTQQKNGNNPISISTAGPLDVHTDVQKDWMDRLNWIFTGTLVAIGGFGVWYARKTLRAIEAQLGEIKAAAKQTEKALEHAGVQAKASGEQVRISELSMIASNRAYVHHHGLRWISHLQKVGERTGYFWRIRPSWINSGNTPTRKLHVAVAYSIRDSLLPDDFDFPLPDKPRHPITLAPKGTIESTSFDVFGDDLLSVRDGKKHLYLWGVARYRDMFSETTEHVTKFCFYASDVTGDPLVGYDASNNPVEIRFTGHPMHNCTDEDCDKANWDTTFFPETLHPPDPIC